ncbi:heterokaryon incompatibility protein-domain-containing protein [Cladorrhinum sp. PSN259]|nr:heterokaryon incompatibility protein-domain-containing protein [Cladorrhinum sp. PSN259]
MDNSNGISNLYLPLDEANDEIRLLTVEPLRGTSIVCCNIERVSLRHHSAAYARFPAASGFTSNCTRRAAIEWCRSRPSSPPSTGEVPAPEFHRFTWGDFAALSYVWGDNRSQKSIMLNRVPILVTENLECALRSMAEQSEFQDNGYRVWIDALCINQNDQEERASQVRKMRDIYSTAWAVISWFGPSNMFKTYHIPKAFDFLRIAASAPTGDPRTEPNICTLLPGRLSALPESLTALNALVTQEYWQRLWIIQEVVMGSLSTMLRCGEHVLDWDTFCRGIAFLYRGDNWSLKDQYFFRYNANGERQVWLTESIHLIYQDLRLLGRAEIDGGEKPGLRRLLEISKSAKCLEVRDKVFALTGLMEAGIARNLSSSYGLSIDLLFAEATKAFITHHNSLEAVRHGNLWGNLGAPTWAVDWTWEGRTRWSRVETVLTGASNDGQQPARPEQIYNAHLGASADYGFLTQNRVLRCSGFIFDEIIGLGAPEDGFFHWFEDGRVPCLSWRSAYGDDQATAQALYRSLLGNTISGGEKAQQKHVTAVSYLPSSFEDAYQQFQSRGWAWLAKQQGYYFKWEAWRSAHDDFMLGDKPLGDYFTNTIPPEAEESAVRDTYIAVKRMVMERRLILTKDGRFGWAPDDMYLLRSIRSGLAESESQVQVGDKIAIVYGCSTPLIIRPSREGFNFLVVGEAYVEGMMYGEAVELLNRGQYQERLFNFQ